MYDSKQISPEELPKSLKELSDPKWKGKLGWASEMARFKHTSAYCAMYGEEETKAWLEGVKNNEPKSYPKYSSSKSSERRVIGNWLGEPLLSTSCRSKWSNSCQLHFPQEDVGNILMVSGAGIRKGVPIKKSPRRFSAIWSRKRQSHFAMNNYEYPTRPNVQTNPDVPDLDLGSVMDIPQEYLIDIGPTRSLLQELALQ